MKDESVNMSILLINGVRKTERTNLSGIDAQETSERPAEDGPIFAMVVKRAWNQLDENTMERIGYTYLSKQEA